MKTPNAVKSSDENKNTYRVDKSELHNKRLKVLYDGKVKPLGIIETLLLKYAGYRDGKRGLIRCNDNRKWESATLKHEVDSYEEFCAKQLGRLKIDQENNFKAINILFDRIVSLRNDLVKAESRLHEIEAINIDIHERRAGEEYLAEAQVILRRNRERNELIHSLKESVKKYEIQLYESIDEIFTRLSEIQETFDTTVKINDRILQHSQRRIDVYWRTVMSKIAELPVSPCIQFNNISECAFAAHFKDLTVKAEKLRIEISGKSCREVEEGHV